MRSEATKRGWSVKREPGGTASGSDHRCKLPGRLAGGVIALLALTLFSSPTPALAQQQGQPPAGQQRGRAAGSIETLYLPMEVPPALVQARDILQRALVQAMSRTGGFLAIDPSGREAVQRCLQAARQDDDREACWSLPAAREGIDAVVASGVTGDARQCTVRVEVIQPGAAAQQRLFLHETSPCDAGAIQRELQLAARSLSGGGEAAGGQQPTQQLTCPAGMASNEDTDGHCCWPGQAWSSAKAQCVGTPECPQGMAARAGTCVPTEPPASRQAMELVPTPVVGQWYVEPYQVPGDELSPYEGNLTVLPAADGFLHEGRLVLQGDGAQITEAVRVFRRGDKVVVVGVAASPSVLGKCYLPDSYYLTMKVGLMEGYLMTGQQKPPVRVVLRRLDLDAP